LTEIQKKLTRHRINEKTIKPLAKEKLFKIKLAPDKKKEAVDLATEKKKEAFDARVMQ
jgi:hypothetical protein